MTSHDGELDQLSSDGEPPEFDLTPRRAALRGRGLRAGRTRWLALGVLVVLVGIGAFLLSNLGGATEYFHQVDEAVAQRADLGTRRFRIQGTVIDAPQGASIKGNKQRITFRIEANGVSAPVVYTGSDPPALFKQCEPVLIVGNWQSAAENAPFLGDQIIIKHAESYSEDHSDRLKPDKTCL